MLFAKRKYDRAVHDFILLGYRVLIQNNSNCVFLKGPHWVEIKSNRADQPSISSVSLNERERAIALTEEESEICNRILQCMLAIK